MLVIIILYKENATPSLRAMSARPPVMQLIRLTFESAMHVIRKSRFRLDADSQTCVWHFLSGDTGYLSTPERRVTRREAVRLVHDTDKTSG